MDHTLWITLFGSHSLDHTLWITLFGSHSLDHTLWIGSYFQTEILHLPEQTDEFDELKIQLDDAISKFGFLPPGILYMCSWSGSVPELFNDFLVVCVHDVTPSDDSKKFCFIFSVNDREPAYLL